MLHFCKAIKLVNKRNLVSSLPVQQALETSVSFTRHVAIGCTRLVFNLRAERHIETCWKPRTDNGVKKWLAKVTLSTIIACSNP